MSTNYPYISSLSWLTSSSASSLPMSLLNIQHLLPFTYALCLCHHFCNNYQFHHQHMQVTHLFCIFLKHCRKHSIVFILIIALVEASGYFEELFISQVAETVGWGDIAQVFYSSIPILYDFHILKNTTM